MKTIQVVQTSIIVALVLALGIHLFMDYFNSSKNASQLVSPQENEPQKILDTTSKKTNEPSVSDQPFLVKQQSTSSESDQTIPLPQLFRQLENSVVQITSKVASVNSNIIINGNPLENQSTRLGSGFVYDTQGHIITNNHVVDGAKTVEVTFVDGNTYTAKVVGSDAYSDIAVIEITDNFADEQLIPVKMGDSSQLEVGEQVIAIGNPFGLSDTMTTGIVSQTGRLLPNQDLGFSIPNVIQTDAAINPGNSGGPLLNVSGEVIGINTAIKTNTGDFSGIGFAVPSSAIKRIVPELIQKGSYSHPWLGISGTSLNPDIATNLGLERNYKGVFVSSVVQGGPAEKAGLVNALFDANREIKSGDVIVSIDGNPVKRIDDVIFYIEEYKHIDDKIDLSVNRNGKILDFTVILQPRPDSH